MKNLGDFRLGDTIDFKFTTTAAATGAPTTLAGTPVLSAYPSNSTTQITAGITLTVDFDAVTGLNHCRIVASSGNGFATATQYEIVVTTGTVGGTSAVGYVAARFSIEATSALMPTTGGRTLDVTAGGNAGIDLDNIALTNGCGPFGIQASGTLSGTHSGTTADLGTNAPASSVVGMTLHIPSRVFAEFIIAHDVGTGVVTFDATGATLANGDQWYLVGTPTVSSSLPIPADLRQIGGDTQSATDLKDFADSGYDPATNKVQGVLLTDTVTTYTGNTPQTGDSYARIGATGSGLTSLATQASVNTIDDFLDTEIAAIKAVTDNLPNSGTLSSLATAAAVTALQTTLNTSRYIKNTVSQKVYFVMVLSSDHVSAATGITVTVQRSLDGAAFGSATGTVTEIGSGLYYLSTSAADTNADDVVFRFTGTACDPVQIHIPTAS